MQTVHVAGVFPDELLELLEAPEGLMMLTPLASEAEKQYLGQLLNAVDHALDVAKRALATLSQVCEDRAAPPELIQKTAVMLAEPMARAAEFSDELRKIIGRSSFAPKTPEAKGPIQ